MLIADITTVAFPPRGRPLTVTEWRPRVSREMSLIMIPVGLALFAFAAALSATGRLGQNPLGMALKTLGATLFLLAVTAELGRFLARHRT